MPSHVAHLLFVEDALRRSRHTEALGPLLVPPKYSYLVLGAQGPDLFYHNQRRKPTGIAYGSLMHRRGYGTMTSFMWAWARARALGIDSWAAAWVLGFATHALLDRHAHPFINAHSGWSETGRPETDHLRSMHPFLERLIDVSLLKRLRGMHPNDLDFHGRASCGDEPTEGWLGLMEHGLRHTYRKAAGDHLLTDRLRSAYLDATGYYRFTNRIDGDYLEAGLRRETDGEIGPRWLSIVHPPEVPEELDVMNEEHREWPHPCSDREIHNESFLDCYETALEEAVSVVDSIVEAWNAEGSTGRREIEAKVRNWNLSDGHPSERPCARRHATPLPLTEVQSRIRESIRNGNGGRLS